MIPELEEFDASLPLEEASTPPSSWYTLDAIYQAERAAVFGRNWIVAARSDQLERAGSFVTGETAGERFVVTRDARGELHAFVNVCRHRASAVASGCGVAEKLVCPYHGWQYGLDGRLITAPDLGGVKGFVKEESGLLPLSVHEWGPLVFVAGSRRPRDLDADLAPLADRLSATGYDRLRFVIRRTWDLDCNWKVFVDNYLDGGYHVPFLHGGLSSQLDLASYRTEIFGRFSIQSSSGASPASGGGRPAGGDFPERIGAGAVYAWIYPSLMINRYGPMMDVNWVIPRGVSRTTVHMDYYFQETQGPEAGAFIQRSLNASDAVQEEDVEICRAVQEGLRSTSFRSGRYSVKRQAGEHHFHRLLASDLSALPG